jgi:hypothetical protein
MIAGDFFEYDNCIVIIFDVNENTVWVKELFTNKMYYVQKEMLKELDQIILKFLTISGFAPQLTVKELKIQLERMFGCKCEEKECGNNQ